MPPAGDAAPRIEEFASFKGRTGTPTAGVTMADRRTVELFDEFMDLVREFIVKRDLGYTEYQAVMKYVISVGEAGEWPLWMDAFLESTVNTSSYGVGAWTPSAITGPYYKENAPLLTAKPYKLPMRPDEPGQPLVFRGKVIRRRAGRSRARRRVAFNQ
jgi:catechol 1,2-dioxygenase